MASDSDGLSSCQQGGAACSRCLEKNIQAAETTQEGLNLFTTDEGRLEQCNSSLQQLERLRESFEAQGYSDLVEKAQAALDRVAILRAQYGSSS